MAPQLAAPPGTTWGTMLTAGLAPASTSSPSIEVISPTWLAPAGLPPGVELDPITTSSSPTAPVTSSATPLSDAETNTQNNTLLPIVVVAVFLGLIAFVGLLFVFYKILRSPLWRNETDRVKEAKLEVDLESTREPPSTMRNATMSTFLTAFKGAFVRGACAPVANQAAFQTAKGETSFKQSMGGDAVHASNSVSPTRSPTPGPPCPPSHDRCDVAVMVTSQTKAREQIMRKTGHPEGVLVEESKVKDEGNGDSINLATSISNDVAFYDVEAMTRSISDNSSGASDGRDISDLFKDQGDRVQEDRMDVAKLFQTEAVIVEEAPHREPTKETQDVEIVEKKLVSELALDGDLSTADKVEVVEDDIVRKDDDDEPANTDSDSDGPLTLSVKKVRTPHALRVGGSRIPECPEIREGMKKKTSTTALSKEEKAWWKRESLLAQEAAGVKKVVATDVKEYVKKGPLSPNERATNATLNVTPNNCKSTAKTTTGASGRHTKRVAGNSNSPTSKPERRMKPSGSPSSTGSKSLRKFSDLSTTESVKNLAKKGVKAVRNAVTKSENNRDAGLV